MVIWVAAIALMSVLVVRSVVSASVHGLAVNLLGLVAVALMKGWFENCYEGVREAAVDLGPIGIGLAAVVGVFAVWLGYRMPLVASEAPRRR